MKRFGFINRINLMFRGTRNKFKDYKTKNKQYKDYYNNKDKTAKNNSSFKVQISKCR